MLVEQSGQQLCSSGRKKMFGCSSVEGRLLKTAAFDAGL
jgi:hypothetical protein